jgi:hypothetical protein
MRTACAAPIAAAVRTSTLIAENTTERGKHMPKGLRGEFWRLAVFAIVCLLGTALIFVTFAQIRFENTTTYTAVFANVSGLQNGNFVRIGGVSSSPPMIR